VIGVDVSALMIARARACGRNQRRDVHSR
jgi:hypothetical protein